MKSFTNTKRPENLKSPEAGAAFEALLDEVAVLENLAAVLNISNGENLMKEALSRTSDIKPKD